MKTWLTRGLNVFNPLSSPFLIRFPTASTAANASESVGYVYVYRIRKHLEEGKKNEMTAKSTHTHTHTPKKKSKPERCSKMVWSIQGKGIARQVRGGHRSCLQVLQIVQMRFSVAPQESRSAFKPKHTHTHTEKKISDRNNLWRTIRNLDFETSVMHS